MSIKKYENIMFKNMNDEIEKDVFLIKTFYQNANLTFIQRSFRTKFKNEPVPSADKL
jgi:hypothetical protein